MWEPSVIEISLPGFQDTQVSCTVLVTDSHSKRDAIAKHNREPWGHVEVKFAVFVEGSVSQKPIPSQTVHLHTLVSTSQIRQLAAATGNQVNTSKKT
jgi:hypothetical protein